MLAVTEYLNQINGIVWGVPMIIAILGTGLFLQVRLRLSADRQGRHRL